MTSAVWQEVIKASEGGSQNTIYVHMRPAGGRLEVVFCVIASYKEKPGDSNSYLLAQLEH